ncbi:cupin [Kitasatospora herbaricolor]|uniref:Cupin domain-containing protein n=1 Tax=Kitasatospora herbaricolor TaxID=68217 RepID=A0ABZ1WG02_9ACTN|nr:cupin domain-containing protein [Kitasatospora herbaricolor]MDQ0307214.1 quercetin dioxygenase-like cupin family protein [Kitasatospora herbaricolor]GGV31274.1 cupin [Kitasatospora herbaricolor]
MSLIGHEAVLVRSEEAETLDLGGTTARLLADAGATGGALSTLRVTLARGADGASPHYHGGSSELFYVTDGELQVLAGEEVVTARAGDLLVVPPELPHAFAAPSSSGADLLIVITPGVERFEYFRILERLRRGEATLEELLATQDRFDNHFLDSPTWRAARGAGEA